jgi:UDP-3-O-[3-hydroxymyristoyl] N-acetylglucosamine deacetylase
MHFALVNRIMSDPTLYEILTFDQLATRVAHALVS